METLARTPEQIGTALRRARKAKGLTQKEVSSLSGLRIATISSVENGDEGTQLKTILAIMMALSLEFRIGERRKDQPDIEDIF
ncbi:MAG: helix-turn-helix domain-containing protein [Pseudomonadota bacterium]